MPQPAGRNLMQQELVGAIGFEPPTPCAQGCNTGAVLQPLQRHPPERLGILPNSPLCHLAAPFPAKCSKFDCLTLGVQSTLDALDFSADNTRNFDCIDAKVGRRIIYGAQPRQTLVHATPQALVLGLAYNLHPLRPSLASYRMSTESNSIKPHQENQGRACSALECK